MPPDPAVSPLYPRGDIRAGAGALTRFVERRLAPRYDWNLEVFQGREDVFPGTRTGGFYRVLNPALYFVRPSAAISALQVGEWLRFGNSVLQLINVFALAERYGLRRVRLPGPHLFYQGTRAGDVQFLWNGEQRFSDLALSGYFLHMRALMPPLDAGVQRRIVDDCVRPLLAPDLLRGDPRVGEDDLVMHFRGGDVFDNEGVRPPPGYWQPPLAYYLAAFEHDRPRRVWLVSEDRRNPTVAGVEETLRLRGVEVIVQSGALLDDLRVLLSARRLVTAIGTFGQAVALLSSRIETFYQFLRQPNHVLTLKGIRVVSAYDAKGAFMEKVAARWEASPADLAMIMSYPVECIRIE